MSGELPSLAAIRFPSGEIFTGEFHSDAIRVAFRYDRFVDDYEEGFLTTEGRFVDRGEAYDLAVANAVWVPGARWFSAEDLSQLRAAGLIPSMADNRIHPDDRADYYDDEKSIKRAPGAHALYR